MRHDGALDCLAWLNVSDRCYRHRSHALAATKGIMTNQDKRLAIAVDALLSEYEREESLDFGNLYERIIFGVSIVLWPKQTANMLRVTAGALMHRLLDEAIEDLEGK